MSCGKAVGTQNGEHLGAQKGILSTFFIRGIL